MGRRIFKAQTRLPKSAAVDLAKQLRLRLTTASFYDGNVPVEEFLRAVRKLGFRGREGVGRHRGTYNYKHRDGSEAIFSKNAPIGANYVASFPSDRYVEAAGGHAGMPRL
jgi:hypothetical protein